jgi:hypothetical protein
MSDKSWKKQERKVAGAIGRKRTPLSGGSSQHTSADVIHPLFYIEVKCRKRIAVISMMKDVEIKARKEGYKIPVLALHQTGSKGRYYLIREQEFKMLAGDTEGRE